MQHTLKLFASLRDVAAADALVVELPEGATAGDLFEAVARNHPALADHLAGTRLAAGMRFVDRSWPLEAGQELALIPPVSGG